MQQMSLRPYLKRRQDDIGIKPAEHLAKEEMTKEIYLKLKKIREREIMFLLTFVAKNMNGNTKKLKLPIKESQHRIAKATKELSTDLKVTLPQTSLIEDVIKMFKKELDKSFKKQGLVLEETKGLMGPQMTVSPASPEKCLENSIGAAWNEQIRLSNRPSPVIMTAFSNFKTRQAVSDTMQTIKNQMYKGEDVISIPNSPMRDGVNPSLYQRMLTDALDNEGLEVKDVSPHNVRGFKVVAPKVTAPRAAAPSMSFG